MLSVVCASAADITDVVFVELALTGFKGDVVVTIVDHPPCESDIGSIDCVSSISIEVRTVRIVLEVGVVDINVLQQDLARVYECHGPHLTLEEFDALDHRICEAVEGDLVWTTRVIADCPIAFVPDLTIAVESTLSIRAVHVDFVAPKDEGSGLALITHR